jgi:ABC-type multidrug transport system fused ATPase/permease subunit
MSLKLREFYNFSQSFAFRWMRVARLIAYNIGVLCFESVAVAMLIPIMLFIEQRGDTTAMQKESRVIQVLFGAFEQIGIQPTFANLLLIAFAAILLRQIVTYVRMIENIRVLEGLLRDVRYGMFARFNAATLECQERTNTGEFVNAVIVEARRTVLAVMMFLELAVLILMLSVYVSMLVMLSAVLTGIVVALMLLIGFGMRGLMQRSVLESRQVTSSNSDMLSFLNERLSAHRLIRLCGMETAEAEEFSRFVGRQWTTAVAIRKTTGIGEVVIEPVVAGTAFVLIFISYEILQMPLATISVFLFIVLRLLPLAKAFVALRQGIYSGVGSLEAMERLIQRLDWAREGQGGSQPFAGIKREIALSDVTFKYPQALRPALSNVSLNLRRGTITALVGPSGGGKSTLIDLLPRLRVPQTGAISIDDIPLENFALPSLRQKIAFAPQHPQIFDVTVAQHIRYGRPEADDAGVRQAATSAGASDFIAAMPQGYDSAIGPWGLQLSGGQKQRLDLARVLAADASLLIFDEPTSNLDNESQEIFCRALKLLREAGDVTVVIIAHRLRLIDWVDQIVVLNEGRVEAAGTHGQVIASCQWYRDAYWQEAENLSFGHRAAV